MTAGPPELDRARRAVWILRHGTSAVLLSRRYTPDLLKL
jgi:hypothetical protein